MRPGTAITCKALHSRRQTVDGAAQLGLHLFEPLYLLDQRCDVLLQIRPAAHPFAPLCQLVATG